MPGKQRWSLAAGIVVAAVAVGWLMQPNGA
jgi:hypothetical protein